MDKTNTITSSKHYTESNIRNYSKLGSNVGKNTKETILKAIKQQSKNKKESEWLKLQLKI